MLSQELRGRHLAHLFMDEMEKIARRPGGVWRGIRRFFTGTPRPPSPPKWSGTPIQTLDDYTKRHKELLNAYRMYDEIVKIGGPGAKELANRAHLLHGSLWKDRRVYQQNLVTAWTNPGTGSMSASKVEIENALNYLKENNLPMIFRPKGIGKGLGDKLNESSIDKYIKGALVGTGLVGLGYLGYQGMKPDKAEYQQVYYGG